MFHYLVEHQRTDQSKVDQAQRYSIQLCDPANLPRDMRLADEAGGLFEYELFFVRNLPPQLSPPNPSQTAPKQPTFVFTVDYVFYNEPPVDRVILAGTVNLGTVKVGDSLTVLCQGGGVAVVLEDIALPKPRCSALLGRNGRPAI